MGAEKKPRPGAGSRGLAGAGRHRRPDGDGGSALAIARDSEPDVIALDLGHPGMDGIEVCRHFRTFRNCLLLMLTHADQSDMANGIAVGPMITSRRRAAPRALVAHIPNAAAAPRTTTLEINHTTPVPPQPEGGHHD